MKKKTIIVFSHFVKNSSSNYLSYTHSHAKEYVKLGYNVITFAPFSVLPVIGLLKKQNKFVKDGVTIYNNRRLSFSKYLKKFFINFNGLFYFLSVIFKVKKIVKEEDVILFDAHNFDCEGYTVSLLKKIYPNIPAIITFHGSDLEYAVKNKTSLKRLKKTSNIIDYYVCVSDKLKRMLNELNIENAKTIYNGINLYDIKVQKKLPKIVSVGDLIPSKNFSLLIQSFNDISKKIKDCTLEIIGDGYLRNILEDEVKSYGLGDKVKFLGEIDNRAVYEKLSNAYIFALPSSPEGFGIVYPEAMYCKCITIGTKGEGIDGFIKDGQNGFLVNPNRKELSDLIINIFNKKNSFKEMIDRGFCDASKLTWKQNAIEYINLIKTTSR